MASEADALKVQSLIVKSGLDPAQIVGVAVEPDLTQGYIVKVFLAGEDVSTPMEIHGVPILRQVVGTMRPFL
jgi:hypothetical protein